MRQRLQKLLAAAGVASRRRAEVFLREGRVRVNGLPASLGDSADPECDRVELDGRAIVLETLSYWLVHKTRGVLTTTRDPHGRPTVLDLLPKTAQGRVFPVGRLDLETEGLVLLTNDGEMAQALLHPKFGSEREYRVTVRGSLNPRSNALRRLERGIILDGGRTASAQVREVRVDPRAQTTHFRLILAEGRKRQIRRSMESLGHPVVQLLRIRMGPLVLGGLAPGRARVLRPDELLALRRHTQRCAEEAAKGAAERRNHSAGSSGGSSESP